MGLPKHTESGEIDTFDVLTAVWVLASNDENPIITYEGIRFRLNLSPTFDVRELVRSRAELFRPGVPKVALDAWKERLRTGNRQPAWLREIKDESLRTQRIDALSHADAFRSQFRTAADSPRSSIEIVEWGLNHIERLRKARGESTDARVKVWSQVRLPLISTLIALTAVITSGTFQIISLREQAEMKEYEVTLGPKREGYTEFMASLVKAYAHSTRNERPALVKELEEMEKAFYTVEPFLSSDARGQVWSQYTAFSLFCFRVAGRSSDGAGRVAHADSFIAHREKLRSQLYTSLFSAR